MGARGSEPEPGGLNRRRVLALGLGLALGGCATAAGGAGDSGTAVIGLRIDDTPALRELRAGYSAPLFSFAQREASAWLSFGRIEPDSGRVDLPMFASLRGMSARVDTEGYGTTFEAERLVPGRYLTREAQFLERPDSRYRLIRVLRFSGSESASAAAGLLGGFAFTVEPGETVYVGTMVLALERPFGGQIGYALPRIVDEYDRAAAEHPELARLGRARATRLMTFVGRGPAAPVPVPAPTPQKVPAVPPIRPVPTPALPTAPPGPPMVPRIG